MRVGGCGRQGLACLESSTFKKVVLLHKLHSTFELHSSNFTSLCLGELHSKNSRGPLPSTPPAQSANSGPVGPSKLSPLPRGSHCQVVFYLTHLFPCAASPDRKTPRRRLRAPTAPEAASTAGAARPDGGGGREARRGCKTRRW